MSSITEDKTIKVTWSTAWMSQWKLFGIDFRSTYIVSGGNWQPEQLTEKNSNQGEVTIVIPQVTVPEDGFWAAKVRAGINITEPVGLTTDVEIAHAWKSLWTIPASENFREIDFDNWTATVMSLVPISPPRRASMVAE